MLFTHHDKYHLHKIIGFLCLSHYFVRFYWLIMYGTMFLNYDSKYTLATPFIHLLLSVSSFIFHVPKNRFDSKIIIWKELQLHNIVFTSRSAVLMIYWLLFNIYDTNDKYYDLHIISRLLLIISHHYIADKISLKYNVKNKTTTRDVNWDNISDNTKKYMKKYYAICQLFAINALLLSESDRTGKTFLESAFLIMFPIQLSAFLMTLVRKNIISNTWWHIFYSVSLTTPYLITINNSYSLEKIKIILSISSVFLRLSFNINKYILMIASVIIYIYSKKITISNISYL